jgi:Domain of unknown function (DUF1998)
MTTIGESRRSQLIGTFGVGAIFPAPEQSLMICGIDHWNQKKCPEVFEPRLSKSLGVASLRTTSSGSKPGDVPVIRFPRYYFCPECRRLDHWRNLDTRGSTSPRCPEHQRTAVPSRFVIACAFGHITDFPYQAWAHSQPQVDFHGGRHDLTLDSRGETSSLANIVVRCSCGAQRSLDGAFSPRALLGVAWCSGERPWLPGSQSQTCKEVPRTLQRGSSNAWFANVRSAISIPPWSAMHRKIRNSWSLVKDLDDKTLRSMFAQSNWVADGSLWTPDRLARLVQDIREGRPMDDGELRDQEYEAILEGNPELDPSDQFVCNRVDVSPELPIAGYVDQIREVSRLREVTALVSFSRLRPTLPGDSAAAQISEVPQNWLPAIEVYGEGIFVRLDPTRLDEWARTHFAVGRSSKIEAAARTSFRQQSVTVRGLLIHSLAHVVMNELSMDAGYPVASLRERLYTSGEQAGFLIYTATADSAGSLGGLCAQSAPDQLSDVVRSAMQRALWCTCDPVCIESEGSGIDNLNLAACHACLLVPETSCELRNTQLDRALLVGTPEEPDAGFFSELARV